MSKIIDLMKKGWTLIDLTFENNLEDCKTMNEVTPENIKDLADEIEKAEDKVATLNRMIRNIEACFQDSEKQILKDLRLKIAHYKKEPDSSKTVSKQRVHLGKHLDDEKAILSLILCELREKRDEYQDFLDSIPEKFTYEGDS